MSGRFHRDGPDPAIPAHPSLLVGAAHLAALWALAFAQPLFDLLGRNPDFFVARGNDAADILLFAFAFALLPPLAMLVLEALAARAGGRPRWALHLAFVALLAAAIALQLAKRIVDGPGGLLIVLSLFAGAGLAAAYARTRFLRSVADVLIPAPALVLAVFLLFSGASELVLPQPEAKAAAVEIPSGAPVVEVVFDELPLGTLMDSRGRIDRSRYPAFAALADEATWYRGATTVAGFTPRAVPAILTGSLPSEDALPIASDHPRSVFTLLGGSYRMNVMENATSLCPQSLCGDEGRPASDHGLGALFSDLRVVSEHLLLPDGIRLHLPAVDETFGGFANEVGTQPRLRFAPNDADQVAIALRRRVSDDESIRLAEFTSRIRDRGRVLNLIHVEEPHTPWTHFPDGRAYTVDSGEFSAVLDDDTSWLGPRSLTDLALQRHLLETGFTDRLLGQLIARLRRTGLWRRALVVVVADHGGAVIPHVARRNPTAANIGQVAPVPLLIKAPGQRRARVVDRHACTTDALPWTARLLGVEFPWKRDRCPPARVTVANSPEGERTFGFDRVERLRDAYVARIERLFGTGSGWGPVLRFGPHGELVGRRVASLPVAPGGEARAGLDDPASLHDADPGAALVSASLLRGGISGGRPGQALAAAVNGRIAAVGRSFTAAGSNRYSLLVAPRFLRRGVNRVALYRVAGAGPTLSLQRLGP